MFRQTRLAEALDEARRLDRFVGNLLGMTRLGHGALVPRRAAVAVAEVIGRARADLSRVLARFRVAVEIDPKLAARLPHTVDEFAPQRADALDVVTADALAVTADDLPVTPTALVANLPYNVAVPVLLHLMTQFPTIATALVMVQAEVADRLAAGPGSRVYGVPSVKARYFGDVARAGAVGRNVFWPEPKVESGLVRITRTDPYVDESATRAQVFAVIDAAFAQRRKTMRSALATWAGSPAEAERRLRAAGIDPQIRGEKLDVGDFVRLAGVEPA